MTRIVVVADTHMPHMANALPKGFVDDLSNSDLCIHAGDVVELSVLKEISKHCDVKAVAGNMDSIQIQKDYPDKMVLQVEGLRIGVTHGSGAPNTILERALESFDDDIDICIYGHSHKVFEEKIGNVFCLNPGSLCDYLYAEFNSYAILEIENNSYSYKIVKL